MKSNTKKLLMFGMILGVIACSMFGTFVVTGQDSHHFNVGYRLWKIGLNEWDPDFARWLPVDRGLSADLAGKTREEVESLIPDLHADPRTRHQKMATPNIPDGGRTVRYLWIGNSNLLTRFEDGGFSDFEVWKGRI